MNKAIINQLVTILDRRIVTLTRIKLDDPELSQQEKEEKDLLEDILELITIMVRTTDYNNY